MAEQATPDTLSSDAQAMKPFWDMVGDILDGAAAMRKLKGSKNPYLPRFPNETLADYTYRVENAKFTNIYRDIVESLAAKPFTKEVRLADGAPEAFAQLEEDVDGSGNHLNIFAGQAFFSAINNAIDWIMVDYVRMRPGSTLADERQLNARPYWVHVPAPRVLAVYSARIGAQEHLVHVRIWESGKVREGFDEIETNRVRIYNREPMVDDQTGEIVGYAEPTYEVWEQKASETGAKAVSTWEKIEEGAITIGVIPMVPVIMGRRKEGTWQFVPPLQDAAYLQVEHFQQESGLKHAADNTAFPMLAGNGVTPPMVPNPRAGEAGQPAEIPSMVPVGPKTVLYAPPNDQGDHGEWKFIEPTAESMKFLAARVEDTEKALRELGRQPLTAQTGNLTVVTTAFAAQKGNSLIQAWAFNLKDALENAWKLTALWLSQQAEPEVVVDTDFDIGLSDEQDPTTLLEMRKNGDLSLQTLADEYQRRGILSADFKYEEELRRLTEEGPGEDSEEDRQAAMTPPADPEAEAA